jgi:hypothetical protein
MAKWQGYGSWPLLVICHFGISGASSRLYIVYPQTHSWQL